MNIRRRTPTLFNLSMVDILCCALGCVILLWLVFSREAKRQTVQALKIADELKQTKSLLDDTSKKYDESLVGLSQASIEKSHLQSDVDKLSKANQDVLALLQKKKTEYEKLYLALLSANKKISGLESDVGGKNKQLVLASKREKALGEELLRFNKLVEQLSLKLLTSDKKVKSLTGQLSLSGKQASALLARLAKSDKSVKNLSRQKLLSEKELKDLEGKLRLALLDKQNMSGKVVASEKLVKKLEKLVTFLQIQSKDFSKKLASSQADSKNTKLAMSKKDTDIARLTKELTELLKQRQSLQQLLTLSDKQLRSANTVIAGLSKDKKTLLQQRGVLHAALANRFAGINLTGKKVVFMVDASGSMSMMDTKNVAPDKWPEVCATLAKIMRSLPDLTHYQVVVFSTNTVYPLGNRGVWLKYDPNISPKLMEDNLLKIQPEGGTKMRPAFGEVFGKYRNQGLDTIYLISDGLPNNDDNLPKEATNLTGAQLTAYLGQLVRHQLKTDWNPRANGKVPVRINAVGYFFESPEVGAFLWALARENNGSFVGVSKP